MTASFFMFSCSPRISLCISLFSSSTTRLLLALPFRIQVIFIRCSICNMSAMLESIGDSFYYGNSKLTKINLRNLDENPEKKLDLENKSNIITSLH